MNEEVGREEKKRKIAIIGGGGAGLISALLLSKQGYEVEIIEKNEYLASSLSSVTSEFHAGPEYCPKRLKNELGEFIQGNTDFTEEQLKSGKDCIDGFLSLLKKFPNITGSDKNIAGNKTTFVITQDTENKGEVNIERNTAYMEHLNRYAKKKAAELGLDLDALGLLYRNGKIFRQLDKEEFESRHNKAAGAFLTLQSSLNAGNLIERLIDECKASGVTFRTNTEVSKIRARSEEDKRVILTTKTSFGDAAATAEIPVEYDGFVSCANYEGVKLLARSFPEKYETGNELFLGLRQISSFNITKLHEILRNKNELFKSEQFQKLKESAAKLSQTTIFGLIDTPGGMCNCLRFSKFLNDLEEDKTQPNSDTLHNKLELDYLCLFYGPDKERSWVDKGPYVDDKHKFIDPPLDESEAWREAINDLEQIKQRTKNIVTHVTTYDTIFAEFCINLARVVAPTLDENLTAAEAVDFLTEQGIFKGEMKHALTSAMNPNKRPHLEARDLSDICGVYGIDANQVTKVTTILSTGLEVEQIAQEQSLAFKDWEKEYNPTKRARLGDTSIAVGGL